MLAAGCGANRHAIYRYQSLDGSKSNVVVTDAKQRYLLVSPKKVKVNGQEVSIPAFCSEPSPDVFSVVAQAVSASGTFGQRPDPKAIEAGLSAAFSSAEQGSTIPRTQTINLLKELMFRTCERYLNGAYDDLEVKIQAARDQRLIVSILAIESLTGAVTPKPVVIGASAEASGGASAGEAVVRLDNAYKDLQSKSSAQQSRQNEYNEITTDKKHCEQIADAVAKKEEDKLPQELKDKKAKCETATAALSSAKKAASEASAYYTTLKEVATSGGIPVSTAATLMDPKSAGGLDRAHSESIAVVTDAVKQIVSWNMGQDEVLFFCLKLMGNNIDQRTREAAFQNNAITECFKYINSTLDLERSKNERAAKIQREMQESSIENQRQVDLQFESFWKAISDDKDPSRVSTSKLAMVSAKVAKMTPKISWPQCFGTSSLKGDFKKCFESIDRANDKRVLSEIGS